MTERRDDAPAEQLDETIPGGKYLAPDGKTFVDANGNEIKATDDAKQPDARTAPKKDG